MSSSKDNTGIIAQEIGDIDTNIVSITGSITTPIDTITVDLSNLTIGNVTMDTMDYGAVGSTITISDGTNSYIGSTWDWVETVPFETGFPNWNDFREMCKEYPGLEKTLEHMKVFYKLCKDEWEANKRGEND